MAEKTISALQYVKEGNDFVPLFPITSADQVYHNIDRVVDGEYNPETIIEYINSCFDGTMNLKGSLDVPSDLGYMVGTANTGDAYIIRNPSTDVYDSIAIWYDSENYGIIPIVYKNNYYFKEDRVDKTDEEKTYSGSTIDTWIAEFKVNNATKDEINALL